MRGHHGDDAVDGERGEDEEEDGRAETEQLHFGVAHHDDDDDDDDDTVAAAAAAAAASVSTLVTNLLPLEFPLPAASSTQGLLLPTNPGSELTSLGKLTS